MQAARGAYGKNSSESNAAMIQGLFGGGHVDHDEDHKRLREQQQKKRITTAHDMIGATPENILEKLDEDTRAEYTMIFQSLDEDGSGEITVNEMSSAFRTMGLRLSNTEIRDLVLSVDKDSNGLIDIGEFCLMLYELSTGTASKTHLNGSYRKQKEPSPSCCDTNCPVLNHQRKRLWACCDDPSSSRWAQITSSSIMSLILISCVAFVWETDPNYHQLNTEFWETLEAFCTACFTIEYVCRVFSTPNIFKFLFDGMNTIDLVAIAPFYVELALASQASADGGGFQATSLRAFRLFRIFRLFKIGRHVSWLQVFSDTYIASFPPLIMIIFIMMIIMVFIASLAHTFEAHVFDHRTGLWTQDDGTIAVVQSIPDGFWYAIVTLTTVGYGDISMQTPMGKLLAMFTSLSGIMVLAIPISVISLNFHDKYEANERKQHQRAESRIRLEELRREMESNKHRGRVVPLPNSNKETNNEKREGETKGEKDTPKEYDHRIGHKLSKVEAARLGNRSVVSLLHASGDRCVLSMRLSVANCLIAEEQNRLDMRHEFKSMLAQWEPETRRDLLRKTVDLRKSVTNDEDIDMEAAALALGI